MFEDINAKKNNAPGNLPVGKVEDMFADTDMVAANVKPTAPVSPAPESALDARKLQPKTMASPSVAPAPASKVLAMHVMPERAMELNKIKGPSLARNLMIFLIVLVGISILFGGSWLVYNLFVKPPTPESGFELPAVLPETFVEESLPGATPEETSLPGATESGDEEAEPAINDEAVLFGEPLDSDADGLSDSRERELLTRPNDWDTDKDGLSDGDEVLIWKSDPLRLDTDGDGYADGLEVKSGYSPIGQGKIFEISQ